MLLARPKHPPVPHETPSCGPTHRVRRLFCSHKCIPRSSAIPCSSARVCTIACAPAASQQVQQRIPAPNPCRSSPSPRTKGGPFHSDAAAPCGKARPPEVSFALRTLHSPLVRSRCGRSAIPFAPQGLRGGQRESPSVLACQRKSLSLLPRRPWGARKGVFTVRYQPTPAASGGLSKAHDTGRFCGRRFATVAAAVGWKGPQSTPSMANGCSRPLASAVSLARD